MSSMMLQEWKWEPLNDSDLEEWLINDDPNNHFKDFSLKSCEPEINDKYFQDINDSIELENNCCLEKFPLFEEIQHLDDVKIQFNSDSPNGFASLDDFNQLQGPLQSLFDSSIENATLVFSNDNFVFIKSDSQSGNNGEVQDSDGELQDVSLQMIEDIANDLKSTEKEVDAAEEVPNDVMEMDQWESDTTGSEVSSNCPTTSGFTFESPKSKSEDESDDPDWNPNLRKTSTVTKCQKGRCVRSKTSLHVSWKEETLEDKRQRKKEQNKYAATRYRLKKKAEIKELLKEEEELKQKKIKLKEKVNDLSGEIRCLKSLMREFFKAKGLI